MSCLELVEAIAATGVASTGSDDLVRVEALLADVVERIVEETGQLAEGLRLEVILLVLLLALLGLILQPVQPGVNGALQVLHPLCNLLLNDIKSRREVSCSKRPTCQQKEAGENALFGTKYGLMSYAA